MILDALKFLADQARGAAAAQRLPEASDPWQERYLIGGSMVAIDKKPPPRDHDVGDLAALIALVKRESEAGEAVVVWYDHEAVVAVFDDAGHRVQRATLNLEYSDTFQRVRLLKASHAWMDQKGFVRLLRVELAGTLDPVTLLQPVRKVRFDQGSSVASEVARNRESLGRTITGQVQADGDVPEEVTLAVPVYSTPGRRDRLPVRCAVEVDPMSGTFRLVPLPDELEITLARAVESIGAELAEGLGEVPAYFGKP